MSLTWTMEEKLLRAYLLRRSEAMQEIVDTSRVFGKRYNAAVDELEEVEELLEAQYERVKKAALSQKAA